MSTVAFSAKDFLGIIADMIAHARATSNQLTDFNVGSVARTLLESSAVELDELYQMMYVGLLQSIPTAIYEGFSFAQLPAQAARGYVTFTLAAPMEAATTIPALTVVRNPLYGTTYETQGDVVIPAGQTTGSVAVAATTTGAATNAIAGSLTSYLPVVSNVSVSNPERISGGADDETAEERRQRFARYIKTLARGTIASLEYAALQATVLSAGGLIMERVRQCAVEETAGHVNLYVFNGSGSTSDDLVAAVGTLIEGYYDDDTGRWVAGYRPAGMRVDVVKMTEVPLAVSIEVEAPTSWRGATFETDIAAAVETVIAGQRSHPTLRPIEIVNAVLGVSGVDGCTILSPTTTVAIQPDSVLVPGAVTISWAS